MSANDLKFVGNVQDGLVGAGWHDSAVRVIARDNGPRTEAWITPSEARVLAAHLIACAEFVKKEGGE